jgi:predicted alpha/beta hydrolase
MNDDPETRRVSAADGYALGATLWGGEGPLVVVNGATGVKQSYYARFARYLAGRGFTAVTWDYRGIGESRPHRMRGFHARMRDWGELDLEGVLRYLDRHYPDRPVLAVGHSVGGQLLGLAPSNTVLRGAITVGSQSGWWGHWPVAARAKMAGLWFGVMPLATRVVGYLPGTLGIGADLPRGVALEWAAWNRSRDYFLEHGVSREGFERLAIPMQAWSFSDDEFAPEPAVDWLHGLYSNARLVRRHVTPAELGSKRVGHFGPFLSRFQDALWEVWARALEVMAREPRVAAAPPIAAKASAA